MDFKRNPRLPRLRSGIPRDDVFEEGHQSPSLEYDPGHQTRLAEELEDCMQGQRVLVQAKEGHRFEGHLTRIQHRDDKVLLTDVNEYVSGTWLPAAFVDGFNWIIVLPETVDS